MSSLSARQASNYHTYARAGTWVWHVRERVRACVCVCACVCARACVCVRAIVTCLTPCESLKVTFDEGHGTIDESNTRIYIQNLGSWGECVNARVRTRVRM